MRLLVLGGSGFVGRAVARAALGRGWSVTTFNRGRSPSEPGVRQLRGNRHSRADVEALAKESFDAVVDTWAGAPEAVHSSAGTLAGSAGSYCYVSSRAVYVTPGPTGMDEAWPTVTASPSAGPAGYPQDKRGGEMAVEAAFGDRALVARAGLILGPGDDSDRLTCWLRRARRGGEMVAPGPPELPVRYVDARDLASWLLDALDHGIGGAFNVCNREGHATMGDFLGAITEATGETSRLCWLTAEQVTRAGIDRRMELPGWLPDERELAGLVHTDVERAHRTGLSCRPVGETVADTLAWSLEAGRFDSAGPLGLSEEHEQALLEMARGASSSA